jgi:DNA-binding FadR family transcriptional regulator
MAESAQDQPPKPRRTNLAEQIAQALRGRLIGGEMQPGDRLPTEKELSQTHGVSRAVVREAIAALRADGLVVARQGSGAFVAEPSPSDLRQSMFQFEPTKLSSIIEVLELRAAVESEAAALAAVRASPGELAKIAESHHAVAEAVARGDPAQEQDFAFHLTIAEATHNQHFVEFFRFLGARTIPRAQAVRGPANVQAAEGFLQLIRAEHTAIVDAIAGRRPDEARTAMTAHLKGSQERYGRLAETNGYDLE